MLGRILWKAHALTLVLLVACSGTPPVIRQNAGAGGEPILYIPRTAELQPVIVEEDEGRQAIRQLASEVRLTGTGREIAEQTVEAATRTG